MRRQKNMSRCTASLVTWLVILASCSVNAQSRAQNPSATRIENQVVRQDGRVAAPLSTTTASAIANSFSSFYLQDRFLRLMIYAADRPNEDKVHIFFGALQMIDAFHSQTPRIVQVNTLEELRNFRNDYITGDVTFEGEMRRLLRGELKPRIELRTNSSEVATEIERIRVAYQTQFDKHVLLDSWTQRLGAWLTGRPRSFHFLSLLSGESPQSRRLVRDLAGLSFDRQLEIVNRFETVVHQFRNQLQTVGTRVVETGVIRFSDQLAQRLFTLLVDNYFRLVPATRIPEMLSALIARPEATTELERFGALLPQLDPQFQKFLQVVARLEGVDPRFRDVLKAVEDSMLPAPWAHVASSIRGVDVPFTFIRIDEIAAARGSMAQIHRGRIRLSDGQEREVAIRVLLPGIRERIAFGRTMLADLANLVDADTEIANGSEQLPKFSNFVDDLDRLVTMEQEIARAEERQATFERLYNGERTMTINGQPIKVRIRVPHVYRINNPRSPIMVMDWEESQSFERFAETRRTEARAATEAFAETWWKSVLTGEGAIHGDIQIGNLRYRMAQDGVTEIIVLDFGMTGNFERSVRQTTAALVAAITLKDAGSISDLLWALSDRERNSLTQEELRRNVDSLLSTRQRAGASIGFEEWITTATNAGLKFPYDFTFFFRGAVTVRTALNLTGSTETMGSIVSKVLRDNPSIAANLASWRTASVLQRRVVGTVHDAGTSLFGQARSWAQGAATRLTGRAAPNPTTQPTAPIAPSALQTCRDLFSSR